MKSGVCLLLGLGLVGCYEDTCNPMYCGDSDENADSWSLSHLQSTLVLDPQLTEREQAATRAAAQAWRDAVGESVQISFVLGEVPERFVVRRALPGELKSGMLASTRNTVIAIGPLLQDSGYLQGGMVHEFGHYLGLGHEPHLPDDIMFPCAHEGMPDAPTPDAVRDLRTLYSL